MQKGGGFPFYYWLFGGLLGGILIGWFFHGFINLILRVGLLIGVIVVVILGVYLWQKATASRGGSASVKSDIPEGNWRDIDPSGRR